jgi:hypothetical protein
MASPLTHRLVGRQLDEQGGRLSSISATVNLRLAAPVLMGVHRLVGSSEMP